MVLAPAGGERHQGGWSGCPSCQGSVNDRSAEFRRLWKRFLCKTGEELRKKGEHEEAKVIHLTALQGEEEGTWGVAQGHPHLAEQRGDRAW